MAFYVNPLNEKGDFELIDGELAELYPHLDFKQLAELTNAQYQEFCERNNGKTKFINGEFVFEEITVDLTALLREQRALMWEKIKQKRHDNLRGGVYVKSIGKWFHSNDESRQQYTFLRTLDALPPNLMWKTMDNSFVQVTKAILDELSLQLVLDEQADFTNAERHKALMEQAESPLDYDFSDGWTETFAEVTDE
ncbi:hypothetical protein BKG95_10130 [Rodentibacter pneumotropicus]|uniref:DUF4376 domain-containing protein n=1 Tax=Rodentibacter pneumotropicus TaxID=758 RepID=A0AAW5LC15_9PAST|nr:DUF4376 domain-containing protein [Rodentibacter pneumotropicus]MCQ9121189.1 DUF4376 domain-containing protein [Rodentibacter pneumotropicus]OOF66557.1 hypothetical protein BKG95_10130 [Rodentibacter pneumotropicus]